MAYATIADLERIAGSAQRVTSMSNPDGDTRNDSRLQEALDEATSIVNSYIGERYRVPLETVPRFLATYTAVIAVWTLAADALGITETELARHKQVLDHLKRISDGKASLAEADLRSPVSGGIEVDPSVGATTSGDSIAMVSRPRQFGRDSEVAS